MKNRNYMGEFKQWPDVVGNFGGTCPAKEPRFVFAEYEVPGYEGYSTVLTSDDGVEYAVIEGAHCSCFGLEGQWDPTIHNKPEIEKMTEANYGFFKDNREALAKWLARASR